MAQTKKFSMSAILKCGVLQGSYLELNFLGTICKENLPHVLFLNCFLFLQT